MNNSNLKRIDLEDGKYTLLHHEGHGGLTILRHGDVWRNETGDKLILAMFHEIENLREHLEIMESAYDDTRNELP